MALTLLTTTMVVEGEHWVRIVEARHSKLPGVPHSPGRQKTTCVGSSSWSVVEAGAVVEAEAVGTIGSTEVEAEAEAGAVGSGGSMVVPVLCSVELGWGGQTDERESLCLETKRLRPALSIASCRPLKEGAELTRVLLCVGDGGQGHAHHMHKHRRKEGRDHRLCCLARWILPSPASFA
jgi:hypothetical protein